MESFDNRIKLQKLIYILSFYGIEFNYNFTWWKHGPYSPKLTDDGYVVNRLTARPTDHELKIIEKLKKGKEILKDSKKAELVASYLYLQQRMHNRPSNDKIIGELITRKPYLSHIATWQPIKVAMKGKPHVFECWSDNILNLNLSICMSHRFL
jgi:uncharacterized protein YwgA